MRTAVYGSNNKFLHCTHINNTYRYRCTCNYYVNYVPFLTIRYPEQSRLIILENSGLHKHAPDDLALSLLHYITLLLWSLLPRCRRQHSWVMSQIVLRLRLVPRRECGEHYITHVRAHTRVRTRTHTHTHMQARTTYCCTYYDVQCIVNTVYFTVYSDNIQYTLYSVYCIVLFTILRQLGIRFVVFRNSTPYSDIIVSIR